MSKKQIVHICSAPAGSYAVIVEKALEEHIASVVPVVAFAFIENIFRTSLTPFVSDSLSAAFRCTGGPRLLDEAFPLAVTWKTFAPGENGLRWAEDWQEAKGIKIDRWDVRAWWPSKSPLFATADETLWSDDFIPPAPDPAAGNGQAND